MLQVASLSRLPKSEPPEEVGWRVSMAQRTAWEYRVRVSPARKPNPKELNELGKDGWELASAVGVGELGAVEEIWYVFKRPVSSNPVQKRR